MQLIRITSRPHTGLNGTSGRLSGTSSVSSDKHLPNTYKKQLAWLYLHDMDQGSMRSSKSTNQQSDIPFL